MQNKQPNMSIIHTRRISYLLLFLVSTILRVAIFILFFYLWINLNRNIWQPLGTTRLIGGFVTAVPGQTDSLAIHATVRYATQRHRYVPTLWHAVKVGIHLSRT